MRITDWTEEREARLQQLWAKNWTARQIAEELGGLTRNGIIGKAFRMGLSKPNKSSVTRAAKRDAPWKPPKPTKMVEPESGVSLLKLTATTCRWPYGEPGKAGFFFCGAHSPRDRPYCAYHQQQATGVPWGKAKDIAA